MAVAAVILIIILTITEIFIIRSASEFEPEISLVYAKTAIPEKTVVTEDMLEKRSVRAEYAHRFSVKEIEDIVGKRANTNIEPDEMILKSKMEENKADVIKVEDSNNRLYTVAFNGDQANGWQITEGQKVDIIYVPDKTENNEQEATLELKNIRIAAVIDEKGKLHKDKDETHMPKYVSFEVTEKQAAFLAAAKGRGRIELSVIPEE